MSEQFNKTTWAAGSPAVSFGELNRMETGIDQAAPAGVMAPYGGAAAPPGWFLCNGQAVNRTTFAKLFAAIGTTFGAGDGVSTFNVPNLQGRLPLGKATSGTGSTLGSAFGSLDHTHSGPSHTHTGPNHTHSQPTHTHTGPLHTHAVDNHGHTMNPPATTTSQPDFTVMVPDTPDERLVPSNVHTHVVDIAPFVNSPFDGGHTSGGGGTGSTGAGGDDTTGAGGTGATGAGGTAATGGGNPPVLVVNYIIKA